MTAARDALATVLAAKAHEKVSVKLEFERQLEELRVDYRRGWIDAEQRDTMQAILTEQWAEKFAEVEAKYAMTLDVLGSIVTAEMFLGVS